MISFDDCIEQKEKKKKEKRKKQKRWECRVLGSQKMRYGLSEVDESVVG